MKRLFFLIGLVVFSLFSIVLFSGCANKAIMTTNNHQDFVINVGDVSFIMKKVEGGTFIMGAQKTDYYEWNFDSDADNDESPVHKVTLSD